MSAIRAQTRPTSAVPRRQRRWDAQSRALFGVGLIIAAFVVFFPTKQLVTQHQRIGRLESRLAALQTENERLELEVERLDDPEQLELEARERLGLVRPGERLWVLVPPADTAASADPGAEAARSWWSRAWDAVRRLFS